MKIASRTADELVLQEGNTSGIVVGAALAVAGVVVAILGHAKSPYAIWIALGLVAAGVAIILFASSITVTANKRSGKILYRKKRLTGGQDSTFGIAEVFRIETRKQWQTQNTANSGEEGGSMPQQVLVAQSVIVFKDGREVALDHQKTSSSMSVGSVNLVDGQGAESAIACTMAEFLGVPFQEIMPPSFGGGLQINIGG